MAYLNDDKSMPLLKTVIHSLSLSLELTDKQGGGWRLGSLLYSEKAIDNSYTATHPVDCLFLDIVTLHLNEFQCENQHSAAGN